MGSLYDALAAGTMEHHPPRGRRRPRPIVHGLLVLVEVERLPRHARLPTPLWLWWRGPGTPDLAVLSRASVHRVDVEQTYRCCKQTLTWTTPSATLPGQQESRRIAAWALCPSQHPPNRFGGLALLRVNRKLRAVR